MHLFDADGTYMVAILERRAPASGLLLRPLHHRGRRPVINELEANDARPPERAPVLPVAITGTLKFWETAGDDPELVLV